MAKIVEFSDYANKDYLIVIPSKGRAGSIEAAQKMFPNSILYVNKDEVEQYQPVSLTPLVLHNITSGYGGVINGIFRECVKNNIRYVAVFDDDKIKFSSLVGNRERHFNTEQIELAIINGCQVLEDLDCYVYLFSTVQCITKYSQSNPFGVNFSLPQGAFIARPEKCGRFVEYLHFYEDFDFLMNYILKERYIVAENRFLCIGDGKLNEGGCNSNRTSENEKIARDYILKKWKGCVKFSINKTGNIRPSCTVLRKRK